MSNPNQREEQSVTSVHEGDVAALTLSIDQEVIILCSAYEQIRSMVSPLLIDFSESQNEPFHLFKGQPHQQMFFVLLVDFLAETDDQGPLGLRIDLLEGLRAISAEPKLPQGGSTEALRHSVDEFTEWLHRQRNVEMWMANLGCEARVRMTLRQLISLYGNRVKHSGLRTGRVAKTLKKIMVDAGFETDAGLEITNERLQLALTDFYDWADEHFLRFYQNQLFGFLSKIHAGIHLYAMPEFKASLHWPNGHDSDDPRYSYRIPPEIESPSGRSNYWDLMNHMRSRQPVRAIVVSQYLRGNPQGITDAET